MSISKRATISDIPTDIIEQLRKNGISHLGNQYLLVGFILDQAGIIPDLIRAYDQSGKDRGDLLDAIEKAVRVGRIFFDSEHGEKPDTMKTDTQIMPEQKAPTFEA